MNIEEASDELPLIDFERDLQLAVARLPAGRPRYAVSNAFDHLERAWRLRRLDPGMAAFRAITAQEEAATALIVALKQQKYPGAQLLNHRDHRHKMAVLTIFHAMRESLARHRFPEAQINVRKSGPPKIIVRFDLAKLTGREGPLWAELPEPFEWYMSSKKDGETKAHDFGEELVKLADRLGADDIRAQIERNANRRNELLYASETGPPQAECTDEYLVARAHLVSAIAVVLLGILQTPKLQSLVVQCLEGLLRALNRVESLDFEYPQGDPEQPTFELLRQEDGKYKIRLPSVPYYRTTVHWRFWDRVWWPRLAAVPLWERTGGAK